jgi:hypothetical protein
MLIASLVHTWVQAHHFPSFRSRIHAGCQEILEAFLSVPRSRDSAGWLWEAYVLRGVLLDGKEHTIPLTPLPTSSSTSSVTANSVRLPFSDVQTYGDSQDLLARQLAKIIPSLLPGRRVLFVSGAPNEATFDTFSVSTAGVDLFQATSAKENHDIKSKVCDLWDSLVQAKSLVGEEHRGADPATVPKQNGTVANGVCHSQDSWVN